MSRDIFAPVLLGLAGADRAGIPTNARIFMSDPRTLPADDRPTKPALIRGLQRKCPNCGEGMMFQGYLKVADHCPVCSEELHHHRADDGPAYLTILLVAHVLGVLMHVAFVYLRPDPLVMAVVLTIVCVAMSLYLLPRLKGMIVGIQWARRMHGFGGAK